ncbi:LuxR family transcriptional regulator [Planotetraspora phitsanulokensis]|uniref:LuxR family transcriptional regulator n=1 Tax=Planotetraspora phitsanulokensis TaxID=575192 RepID=A0A8J3XP24_9ACTN|nr:LuxR family transcriptional regulator [Planotetraspora phitsanulokensis]GII43458.1 LuxR family transcriptional regulator [Planotetraspora phitsanulokensis]
MVVDLVGRDAELRDLLALLDGLKEGGGALVLSGAAGVGKSALIGAATAEACARGERVLTVTGVPAEGQAPYEGLRRLLAGTGLTSGDLDGEPLRTAMSVLHRLSALAGDTPVVLAVEDAHWLDEPSWEALAFVGRRLRSDAVVLLATLRDDADSQARLAASGLPALTVPPLTDQAAVELLARVAPDLGAALRARVLTEAAGNPLALIEFATLASRQDQEVLASSRLPLTERLERAFAQALATLPPDIRTLALIAAVNEDDAIEENTRAASLLAGAPIDAAALAPAVRAGLVMADPMRVKFRHPLIRSAIVQAAGADLLRDAHAALAAALPDNDRRIWHRAAATTSHDDDVAAGLAAAAMRAHARGAPAFALEAMERAAYLSADPARRGARLIDAAVMAFDLGDRATLERLFSRAEDADLAPIDRSRLTYLRGITLHYVWTGVDRLSDLAGFLDEMRARDGSAFALSWLAMVSMRWFFSNPSQDARAPLLAAIERLAVPPDDPQIVTSIALVAPVERGRQTLARLDALSRASWISPLNLHLLGMAASAVGAFPLGARLYAEAIIGMRTRGPFGSLAQALVGQATSAARLADTRLGVVAAAEARALAVETGQPQWALTVDAVSAEIHALRGQTDVARDLAAHAERAFLSAGAHPMLALVQLARGAAELADGTFGAAWDALRPIFDPSEISYSQYMRLWALPHLAEAALLSGRQEELRAVADELAPVIEESGSPVGHVALAYIRAVTAPDETAEELFTRALREDLVGWPFERARLRHAWGAWLRRQRRAAEARAPLRAAAEAFDALGAVPWSERALRELRASGERIRRKHDTRDRLTAQELQIAQLVADGLTNRDIGQRLFVSPRTVSTHLSRIFPKLGITTRGELSRLVAAREGDYII